ncbi:hypothetical protein FKG94_23985 [Exilibacterium tricleocarpae]|uniref:VCBS repeat-containing protein n=1 Tax=Exilibacterium tricleocarpae TaxID=2591008 RepID=A0A545ST62_9GAMM|nr:hypothetical protein [Exilibacterium tricleocarpae]TQV68154.1 hypothetical protein FKG94_23985 [Exilibacterium tricleocarpae]
MKTGITLLTALLLCAVKTFASGFDNNTMVKIGDYNNNGLKDFYIRQQPKIIILHGEIATPIILPTAVKDFVLANNGNGTFTIIGDLSNQDKQAIKDWPLSSVDVFIGDFNVDGSFDLNLRNISTDIAGAMDQIIYAGPTNNSAPIGIRALDTEFQNYFSQVYEWILDENYFENTAIENGWYDYQGQLRTGWWGIEYISFYYIYGDGKPFLDDNDDPKDPGNRPAYCEDFSDFCRYNLDREIWQVYGTYLYNIRVIFDYSHFNQDARNTTTVLGRLLQSDEDQANTADVGQLETTAETILQTTIELPTPGEVVEIPTAIPIPGDSDRPDRFRRPKLGWLGYYLFLLDLAEWANKRAAENRMVYHYTNAVGRQKIIDSGEIINLNTPIGGDVYFTYLAYPNSEVAMELLALCGAPRVGFFAVKQANIPDLSLFTRVTPFDCEDGTHPNGGGWEATAASPVNARPIRFIPIAERF